MKIAAPFLLLVLLLMAPAHAALFGGIPQFCVFGSAYADGCAQAFQGAGSTSGPLYQNSAFFTYAKQSGQGSYYSAPSTPNNHPMPWNVAGVDYPVGVSTGTKFKDPAVDSLPASCTYNATGSRARGPIVKCNGSSPTFNGWDFSLHNCTVLEIQRAATGTVTIENSKFVNGTNCQFNQDGFIVSMDTGGSSALIFENNYLNGLAQTLPTSMRDLLFIGASGAVTIEYNAFLNCPCRPVTGAGTGDLIVMYNYVEGFVYSATDGHGEFISNGFSTVTKSIVTYSFNTGLQPSDVYHNGANAGSEAFWYPVGNAATPGTITTTSIDHNTSIGNKNGGNKTIDSASTSLAQTTYTNSSITANYMDPTGSHVCIKDGGSATFTNPTVFTGNINMINGNTVTGFGACP